MGRLGPFDPTQGARARPVARTPKDKREIDVKGETGEAAGLLALFP